MRTPLTICGLRLQFADSAYSCGFRYKLTLLKACVIACLWISQTVSDSAIIFRNNIAVSAKSPIFEKFLGVAEF